jgi:hypothetical protein
VVKTERQLRRTELALMPRLGHGGGYVLSTGRMRSLVNSKFKIQKFSARLRWKINGLADQL